MIPFAYSFIFSFLLVVFILQSVLKKIFAVNIKGYMQALTILLISVLITAIPFQGLCLAQWIFSMNANFSIPLTAILLSRVIENASGIRLLDRNAVLTSTLFGLIAGTFLYPMALGLGRFDPYEIGWSFSFLFMILMAVTLLLIIVKNRFGIVLTVCILGYNIRIMESHNLWDYIADPVFMIISCIYITTSAIKHMCTRGPV